MSRNIFIFAVFLPAPLLALSAALAPLAALAAEPVFYVKEIQTGAADKALAAREAALEVSWDLAREALGEQKLEAQRAKIKKRVIDSRNRYILSTKPSAPELQEDGSFLTEVRVGVSKKNFQSLLVERDLFYSSQGVSCLLPVVSFEAELGSGAASAAAKESYLWWAEPWEPSGGAAAAASGGAAAGAVSGSAAGSVKTGGSAAGKQSFRPKAAPLSWPRRMAAAFFQGLSRRLLDEGFYVIDPVFERSYEHLPRSAAPAGSLLKHFEPLARLLRCDIVASGAVRLRKDEAQVLSYFYFKVFNIKTRQILFHVKKQKALPFFPLGGPQGGKAIPAALRSVFEKDIFENFAYQLALDKETGSLDLSRLLLGVQGPLNHRQKEKLKEALERHVPAIKSLQERLLASNRIIYEMESQKRPADIAKSLKATPVPFFHIQVTGYDKRQLNIYAKELAAPAPSAKPSALSAGPSKN